eukprot:scaffold341954_cov48-Prasinocladus_malaysianus.AAC.1
MGQELANTKRLCVCDIEQRSFMKRLPGDTDSLNGLGALTIYNNSGGTSFRTSPPGSGAAQNEGRREQLIVRKVFVLPTVGGSRSPRRASR